MRHLRLEEAVQRYLSLWSIRQAVLCARRGSYTDTDGVWVAGFMSDEIGGVR